MPAARRARSPAAEPMYAGDTDQESENDTPKPSRNLKKRVSEVYHPDNDGSFTEGAGVARPPLRTVNINDDAAEKRRRRKSTKIAVNENALAGPSSEGAMQQDSQLDNNGAESSRAAAAKQKPLKSVVAPMINVPRDVMSSNFEEWMKMATDNVCLARCFFLLHYAN